ncbi:MAG TPA: hypothetical protein V6D03_05425, partial [Candidatus Caenarcaniphilales bacterium]
SRAAANVEAATGSLAVDASGTNIAPLSAVLVTKAPGSGQFPYLVCLGKDNRWYVVTPAEVVALHTELPRLEWVDNLAPPVEMQLKPGQSRSGTTATLALAQQIPQPAVDPAPEVLAQFQQVEAVEAQLKAHPAHGWQNHSALLKLQRRESHLQEQLKLRTGKLEEHSEHHWQEFLNLIEILQRFGALEGLTPTPLGQAAAAIRGENELWLGLALMSGELNRLDPHHLAAACAALVTEVSRPDSWTHHVIAEPVESALASLRPLRRQLLQLQRRGGVALPVWLEYQLIGLVEQWALGATWPDLCASTSLDEGDIVRILRRTLDLLSQVPHVPYISVALQQNAYRSIQLIDRFPVNEAV